jgi:hypothetical protein
MSVDLVALSLPLYFWHLTFKREAPVLHKLTLIAVAVLVAGCSDPKAANEKNFQSAIQSYLDTAYPKCYFNQKFPTTVEFDIGGSRAIL